MKSPALVLPKVFEALQMLSSSAESAGLSRKLAELLNLRASQINGCAVCLDMHSRALVKLGETSERLACVAAWREAPYYTDAERAALALTEALTRTSDRADAVPDDIWNEAARHFAEPILAAIVLSIATINLWNRLNIGTRQITGPWIAQYI
jgi:AhpD family alkylhydroperoxidase